MCALPQPTEHTISKSNRRLPSSHKLLTDTPCFVCNLLCNLPCKEGSVVIRGSRQSPSSALLSRFLPCWLVTSRSKSVTRPSRLARMMARFRSWTEMWKPSHGMAEYSMSFLNLNRTDISEEAGWRGTSGQTTQLALSISAAVGINVKR